MQRHIDRLVTPAGAGATVGALLLALAATTWFVVSAAQRTTDEAVIRADYNTGHGYRTLSDLNRITNVLIELGVSEGDHNDAVERLLSANDILYVRADALRRVRNEEPGVKAFFDRLIPLMSMIVDEVDALAAEADFNDGARVAAIVARMDEARSVATKFIDAVRRDHHELMKQQVLALNGQTRMLLVVLAALTGIGVVTLILLRREILLRKEREQARRRADFLAYFDPLTELPNRVQFADRATEAVTRGTPSAFAMIDLDKFKDINDTLGHAAGDRVLTVIGQRLHDHAQDIGGFAARIAGDEFAVWLPIDDPLALESFAKDLIAAGCMPVLHGADKISAGLSIGIATTSQVDQSGTADYETMMRIADFALYISKEDGRGRFTIYDADLERQYTERRALLDDLRAAVDREEIDVYLQPKVYLETGRVYGFEALARWRRKGESVSPGVFVELAEEAGFVAKIDLIVLRGAVHAVADWNQRHGTEFEVSVNLSGLHFNAQDIVKQVHAALSAVGLPPRFLTLEITETVQLRDWARVTAVLDALRALGCRISIDDFGTGYSSLGYLRRMHADELKIDKTLVDEVEGSGQARFILDSVVELAQEHLGFDVVVEGVESETQVRALRAMGCRKAQGFFFGRPEPAQAALARADPARPGQVA